MLFRCPSINLDKVSYFLRINYIYRFQNPLNRRLFFQLFFYFFVRTLKSLQFVFFAVLAFLPAQPLFSSDMRSIKDDSIKAGNFYTIAVQYAKDSHLDSSNIYFEKAGIIWKAHERWKNYLDCLQRISKNLVRQRNFTQALNVLTEGIRIGKKKCNSQCDELGGIYIVLGYINLINEDYEQAIENVNRGLTLFQKLQINDDENKGSGYYTLGFAYKALGNYDQAIVALEQTRKIQINAIDENHHYLANTLTMLGSIYDDKNEFDKAIECYNQSLQILSVFQKINSVDAAACYHNMMISYNNKGDYYRAIEHGKTTIQIYIDLLMPEHPNVASTYGKLGEIYTTIGDYEKAKDYLERSLQIFTSRYPEKRSAVGALYHRLGEVYKQTGDLAKALSYSTRGIHLLEQTLGELHPQTGFMYELLAGVYAEQKNFSEALTCYRKAIAARERVENSTSRNDIAALYSSIAGLYIEQNKLDSASFFMQKAKTIESASSERNIPQYASMMKRFGDLSIRKKNYRDALRSYHHAIAVLSGAHEDDEVYALPELDKSIYKKDLLDVVTRKANTFEVLYRANKNLNDLRAAFRHYQQAASLVDDVRKQYSADASKFHLAEKSKSIYANACRLALALYAATNDPSYNEQAFLIADRSKANIILEKLFDGEAKYYAGIPDSLLQREKELLQNIAFCETQIYKLSERKEGPDGDAISRLKAENFALKTEHQQLVELFGREYPKYFELKYARYSLSLNDVQERLEPNTVLVEYLVDRDAVYAFGVTKDRFVVKTLTRASALNSAVERFTASLKKYDSENYLSSGYELYAALLQPFRKELQSHKKVIVIPDGNLYYVPFEALPVQRYARTSDFTALRYVISQNEVSYSYSAEFYLKMSGKLPAGRRLDSASGSTPGFVGFAPVFRDSTKNGDFLANRSSVEESGISDVRSITLDGKTFNELKYSEEEIVSISGSFASHSLPAKSFLHTAATETNFKEFSRSYDIIHVATHGFINEKNPKFSAILFSQPAVPTPDDDGILYVDETFNLNLKAQLVVLSSCESGLGKLVQGEGMIALTRGLFYAGAKNIVFSLWKVSDKQTYLLMDEFYKQLLAGSSYSSALREAKLKMISSKESAFPSKWSGFVLVGK